MDLLLLFGYCGAALMGLILGLLGAGGAILTVPILVYLFQIPAMIATTYSLIIVGVTAFIASINYYRSGEIDLKTATIFAIPSFIAVYLVRAYIVPNIPDVIITFSFLSITKQILIMGLFSVLMFFAGLAMIQKKEPLKKNSIHPKLKWPLIGVEGLIIGAFTGLIGAGGGFLIVPTLVILTGLPIKVAVGSSLFIIAVKSLIGVIGDFQAGTDIDWEFILRFLAATFLGLYISYYLKKYIHADNLKRGFGVFTIIMAIFILLKEIH